MGTPRPGNRMPDVVPGIDHETVLRLDVPANRSDRSLVAVLALLAIMNTVVLEDGVSSRMLLAFRRHDGFSACERTRFRRLGFPQGDSREEGRKPRGYCYSPAAERGPGQTSSKSHSESLQLAVADREADKVQVVRHEVVGHDSYRDADHATSMIWTKAPKSSSLWNTPALALPRLIT